MTQDLHDWKTELGARCAQAIAELPEVLEADSDPSATATEDPALYQLYEDLLALRNEVRKVNRKTADAFGRFGEVLETMQHDSGKLRKQLLDNEGSDKKSAGLSRNVALALVDLLDRVKRLEDSTRKHRDKGWRGILQARQHQETQEGALAIFTEHLKKLFSEVSIVAIPARPGTPFDPLLMKAVEMTGPAASSPGNDAGLVVAREVLPGYRMGPHCLRPAEVTLTHGPKNP